MKNSALEGFQERFQSILDDFDGFEMDEELEELNAQLEDALFLMECSEDDVEELQGAIEEIDGLLAEYRALSERRPELRQKVLELEMAAGLAGRNLN